MPWSAIWTLLGAGYVLTWLLVPWVLLKRTVHTSAAVAWIMAIIFVPYVGAALCLMFGTMRWERRVSDRREASARVSRSEATVALDGRDAEGRLGRWEPLARLVREMTGAEVTAGNRVEHLPDTNRSLGLLRDAIVDARRWIHIELYIWRQDRAGSELRDLLIRRAREGLEVRMLYDGVGSMLLSRNFIRELRSVGVRAAPFTPGLKSWHLLTLNLRNHRKIVVVDGQVGFTGGMNVGDEYLRPTRSFGQWRDTQLLVTGPAARQLHRVFSRDWYYATGELLTGDDYRPRPEPAGDVVAQVVADGPDNDVDTFHVLMVAAIGRAEDRITLTTPYFVPPDAVAVALEAAARRGVSVRLVVARRGNWWWTLEAGRSYYERLLKAGVEIHEYHKGLYHAKMLVVDGQWLLVGTPNCDYRSLFLNFEVALAMYDVNLATDVERQVDRDLRSAGRIVLNEWLQRPKAAVLQEQFCRLFAPVL